MIIQPTSLAALTWAGAASGTTAQSWRIGVVYSARPLGFTDAGKMVLQIGALTVETEPPTSQLPGQFQVRVLSLGSQPQLQVLAAQVAEPMFQRALRERLPQQNGLAPLLATIKAVAQRSMVRQLPPELRPLLAQLERAMPSAADIGSGEGLRQAISRSGLFLESSLLRTPAGMPPPEDDWKGVLLKLAGALEQTRTSGSPASNQAAPSRTDTAPPLMQRGMQPQARALPAALASLLESDDLAGLLGQLKTNVQAALARIEITQLEASATPAWMIEIPLRSDDGSDVLQLQLEFGAADNGTARDWTMGFALDLPPLGPVQGELQLRDLRLSVRLWAQRSETTERLERQFAGLRHRLSACGLLLDQLSCQTGMPQALGRHSAMLLQATA